VGPTPTSSGAFGNAFVEAPALFKRQGVYYALFGECCCFCSFGSGIQVQSERKPPHTHLGGRPHWRELCSSRVSSHANEIRVPRCLV
jgi:hypothetical protein